MAGRGRKANMFKKKKKDSSWERNVQELMIEDMYRQIMELKRGIRVIQDMRGHISKLTCQLKEVRSLRDSKKSDHEPITSFENSFQKHDQVRQLLDRDEYRENFGYPIYGKIDVD
jgi:hypothetical protein